MRSANKQISLALDDEMVMSELLKGYVMGDQVALNLLTYYSVTLLKKLDKKKKIQLLSFLTEYEGWESSPQTLRLIIELFIYSWGDNTYFKVISVIDIID